MEWESSGGFQKGAIISVTDKDVVAGITGRSGRPTGMGGRLSIRREDLINNASHLLELSIDKVTKGGEGTLKSEVMETSGWKLRECRWEPWDVWSNIHRWQEGPRS